MGFEENPKGTAMGAIIGRQQMDDFTQRVMRERAEAEAREHRKLEDAMADQRAIWTLAEFYLPADIREMGARNKMEETICELWRAAFIAGWRAHYRAAWRPGVPDALRS